MSEGRKVFRSKDARCEKCGGPLGFYKLSNGKWCPCNPDGSDHWDDCREFQTKGTYGIKREFRVATWGALTIPKGKPNANYYNGDIPPWEFPTFIECVENPSQLKNKGLKTVSLDTHERWTNGEVKRI